MLAAVVWALALAARSIRQWFGLPADALAGPRLRFAAPSGPRGIRRGAGLAVAALAVALVGNRLMAAAASPWFRHHSITRTIPQVKNLTWGYGTPALADFDRDGDLDYACSTRAEKLYWFENRGPAGWVPHVVGEIAVGQLGATVLDVDRDGWPDIVIGGYWYRNSRNPGSTPFTRYHYDRDAQGEIHDIVTADVDGDGRLDVIELGDKFGCFWYKIPDHPLPEVAWTRTLITDAVLDQKDDIHGGFFPRGAGDLDKDGDVDLVLPDRWLENTDQGRRWSAHPLPFGKRGPWGLSSRSWILDLDQDGDNDIVIVDCDQKDSRVAWLENDGGRSPTFRAHFLPRTAPGTRGSFHSLAVADFDGDGDLDIVTAEQEDPSILPAGAAPRWYLWENSGGKVPTFMEHIILDQRLGGHDILVGDIDGDGDLDLAAKIWRRWPENGNGGNFHADWLENLSPPRPGPRRAP